jgi:hypothetical protein
MKDLTDLERKVMQAFIDGEDDILSILREQLEAIVVVNREMTGVGFFTTFVVSDEVRRADDRSFKLGDVIANISGLAHGAGFLLYVEHGALHMLEGYTYDEPWPKEISAFELTYRSGDQRDLEALRKILHGDNAER